MRGSPVRYGRSPNWGTGDEVELDSNSRTQIKRGDIVELPDTQGIPKYAKGCFGVVTKRYKTVKRLLDSHPYYNYGVELMLLDGPKKGKTIRLMNRISGNMKRIS